MVAVTYRAPKGDNKVCEWGGFTFFDGVPVEVEETEGNAHMLRKIAKNRFFELAKSVAGKVKERLQERRAHKLEPDPEPLPDDPEPDPEPDSIPEPEPEPEPEPPKRKTLTVARKPVRRLHK